MPWGRGPWFVVPAEPAGGWQAPWRAPRGRPAQPLPGSFTRPVRADLDQSAGVVLNNAGAGFVQLAPDGLTVWQVRQAHVATSTGPTDASACFLYAGGVFPHRQLAETSQGGGDSFSFEKRLRPGDTLIAVWSGGNPGDTATLNVTGKLTALVGR